MKFDVTRYVPKAVSRVSSRQALKLQKNAPHILLGAGVVGVVATAVLASRATLKLDSVLEASQADLDRAKDLLAQKRSDYTVSDYNQDVIVIRFRTAGELVRLYAVPTIVGAASIACLISSHRIMNSRNLALTAAYAALEKSYSEYRERVVNHLGVDKEAKLYSEVVRKQEEDREALEQGREIVPGGSSIYSAIFNKHTSSSWSKHPEDNWFYIKCQENYANVILHSRGHIFLNEVLDSLNLPRTPEGQIVGWVRGNGDDHVSFGFFEDANNPYNYKVRKDGSIVLDFNVDGPVYKLI